jgi:pimeloyl-ACP methyl ester carboxylesterase
MNKSEEYPVKKHLLSLPDGRLLSYTTKGSGSLTIIFIHGFPLNQTMWQAQMQRLTGNVQLITFDLCGYGHSSYTGHALSISSFADDLMLFIQTLQIQKVVLCGLSMGGYIALNFASRYADRVAGLILCDTQCENDSEEVRHKRFENVQKIRDGGKEDFFIGMTKALFSDSSLSNKQLVNDVHAMMYSVSDEVLIQTLMALANRSETCSHLKEMNVPVLLLCGQNDQITPPHKSLYMQQQIPNSKLHIIPQAGHLSNMENSDYFNTVVGDFIKENF